MTAPALTRVLAPLTVILCMAAMAAMAAAAGIPALPAPPSSTISETTAIVWNYRYSHDYSAHTNGAHICGKMMPLALTSWTGNTATDYRLMRQIRTNLAGSTCLVAAGGYACQHEKLFTAACVIIQHTPRLWAQLTDDEKHKMDLLIKASLIASAYTTSDTGNQTSQNRDLMGGSNLGRGWNPNFREGMIGNMIVSTIWLGGAEAAYDFLDNYDHAAFTAELLAAGLTNTYITFNYRVDHPTSYAPTAAMIERDVADYEYLGYRLSQLMEIYASLTLYTYDKHVNTGLNGGAGINGAGRMLTGQADLPNLGVQGMLHEFDGSDAGGARSSAGYAYDGFRPNLVNQIVMLISGYWESGDLADACLERMRIGVPDLFYKLEHGYYGYSKGSAEGQLWMTDEGRDFYLMRSVWEDVILPYHDGLVSCADAGSDFTAPDHDGDGWAEATLDATASTAASGQSLVQWLWSEDGMPLATSAVATVALAAGVHELTLTVVDSSGRSATDTVMVTVEVPPLSAIAGDDVQVAAAETDGVAVVFLDASASVARDGTIITVQWYEGTQALLTLGSTTPPMPYVFSVGVHELTLMVYDDLGNTAFDAMTVTVTQPAEPIPGDANNDGHVDVDDFILLKQHYNTPSGASWSQGDFNGDGAVNIDDFVLLKQNYGR